MDTSEIVKKVIRGRLHDAMASDHDKKLLDWFLQYIAVDQDFLVELGCNCGCARHVRYTMLEPTIVRIDKELKYAIHLKANETASLQQEFDCPVVVIPETWSDLPIFGVRVNCDHREVDGAIQDRRPGTKLRSSYN